MRRMWAASAAIVVCVALGGMPALAQEVSPLASPVASPEPGTTVPVVFTGEESAGQFRLGDPRVSGYHTETFDNGVGIASGSVGAGEGGFLSWGILTLHGPDGDWIGPWAVMAGNDFPTVSRIIMTLEGTEAYEGLAAVLWETTPKGWDGNSPQEVEGVIYEGSAPRLEWPEPAPSPASE